MRLIIALLASLVLALGPIGANPIVLLTGGGVAGSGGGVGTDPASVANRVIHLIGDDTTGADASTVVTWPAATGTSNAGAMGDVAPIKKTGIANGHTVVRFDAETFTSITLTDLSALTAGTGYVVVKINADPPVLANSGVWGLGAGGQTYYPYTDGAIYCDFGSTVRKDAISKGGVNLSSAFRVYAVSSAAGAWANYLDGVQLHTTASNTVGFPAFPRLGNSQDGTRFLDGDIAEFVLFSDAHDATTVGNISAFLEAKYNP